MSFLFKSRSEKKTAAPTGLPPASRNIHTSDGTPSAVPNGIMEKPLERSTQSPQPVAGQNNSISSVGSSLQNAPQAQFARRERSESEAGVCLSLLCVQIIILTKLLRLAQPTQLPTPSHKSLTPRCIPGRSENSTFPLLSLIRFPDMARLSMQLHQKRATSI